MQRVIRDLCYCVYDSKYVAIAGYLLHRENREMAKKESLVTEFGNFAQKKGI